MDYIAYLDAGTGSVIIQAMIGFFAAIGVILKVYWHKVVGLFGGGSKEQSKDLRSNSKANK